MHVRFLREQSDVVCELIVNYRLTWWYKKLMRLQDMVINSTGAYKVTRFNKQTD